MKENTDELGVKDADGDSCLEDLHVDETEDDKDEAEMDIQEGQ